MTDQTSPPPPPPPPERDWRDMRRDGRFDRQARRQMRWGASGSWAVGLILIALGALFLAQNFGYPVPHNWWAFFILIPAIASFVTAWNVYRRSGEVTPQARAAFVTGLILTGLSLLFLLDIEIGRFWPLILIVIGLGILFGGTSWRRSSPPR